jgi:catechol 2,3-dioxygenase-like lactoylglutathione lyase family enzyme
VAWGRSVVVKLGHLEVFVADAVRSRDWYVAVLGAKAVADQGAFQWVDLGGVELLFRPGAERSASSYREAGIAMVLYVDDLAAFRGVMESHGVVVTHGDEDACLTIQDPDGHWIQATCNS